MEYPWYAFILFSLILFIKSAGGSIDCFKCVSIDGSNPACDDPFHNNYTESIYQVACKGGRKHRNGLFPATACLKMNGHYVKNGTRLMVRHCALDSGTLTTDTEIIRMSHCGYYQFDGEYIKGCLQSCNDADGCNTAAPGQYANSWAFLLPATLLIIQPS